MSALLRLATPAGVRSVALSPIRVLHQASQRSATACVSRSFCVSAKTLNDAEPQVSTDTSNASSDKKRVETDPFRYLMRESSLPEAPPSSASELADEQLSFLPVVYPALASGHWRLPPADVTLPQVLDNRRSKSMIPETYQLAYWAYRSFDFKTAFFVRKFSVAVNTVLDEKFIRVKPIILTSVADNRVVVGLPCQPGLKIEGPGKDAGRAIVDLIKRSRELEEGHPEATTAAHKFREIYTGYGFLTTVQKFNLEVHNIFRAIREQEKNFKQNSAASPIRTPRTERRYAGHKTADATTKSPDDPSLPEAGTFVAQDGDSKSAEQDESLADHVPFPTPSAEEMGENKPTHS
ncbi:hypothetical protein BCV70DRAFT_199190 [Testicularia cyperi]|uniref:Uncharacterized protein n=1 Tax=Testicularia cyperi TaxID=1882483 RepID=A0A317XWQ7_9BASI|nr:hypothetical protein BCV70DRAFT_199190 [Testicularia cyperi]